MRLIKSSFRFYELIPRPRRDILPPEDQQKEEEDEAEIAVKHLK